MTAEQLTTLLDKLDARLDPIPEDILDKELLKGYDNKEKGIDSIVIDDEIKQAIANIEARKKAIRAAKKLKETNDE